jgi:bacterial/archaeal transporter family protein
MAGWLVPTLLNILAVGMMGVASSRALRGLTWRSLVFPVTGAYVVVAVVLLALGDARLALDGDWGWALVSGLLTVTAFVGMNVALTRGEAGEVVAVSAAFPTITLLLAAVVLDEAVTAGRWLGTLLVVAGVALIAHRRGVAPGSRTWGWVLPTAVFTCALGVVGVTSRLAMETLAWQDLIVWATLCYLVASVVVLAAARAAGERIVRVNGWGVVAGSLAVGALATLYVALGEGEASTVIPVSAAFPIVTLLLAWALLGERLTLPRSMGTLVVIGGVVIITAL